MRELVSYSHGWGLTPAVAEAAAPVLDTSGVRPWTRP
jgi:hypothetical protein